jgi:hypothetical protein
MRSRIDVKERKIASRRKDSDFTPGRAVQTLVQAQSTFLFEDTWQLAWLLAWAILDQRANQRPRKDVNRESTAVRKRFASEHASQVGLYTLALFENRQAQKQIDDETTKKLRRLIKAQGGMRAFVLARGSRNLYNRSRVAERDLRYIYLIVEYLCRCKQYGYGNKADIETAKQFISQCAHEGNDTYGVSKIEKLWLKYKDSAPYIFSFHRFIAPGLGRKAKWPEEVLTFLETLASDRDRMKELIGRAAYAADILDKLARNVRIKDFDDVQRAMPPLRPFNEIELAMINNIDRNAPIC